MRYLLKNLYKVQLAKVTNVKHRFYDTNYYPYFDCDTTVSILNEPDKFYFAILKRDRCSKKDFYIISKQQTFTTVSSSAEQGEIVISALGSLGFNIPPELKKTKLSRRQIIKIEQEINSESQN